MIKYLPLILFFFQCFFAVGQTSVVNINWKSPTMFQDDEGVSFYQLTFDDAEHVSSYSYLPASFETVLGKKITSYDLTDVQTDFLNPVEDQFVNKESLTHEFQIEIHHLQNGDSYTSRVVIIPLRISASGAVEKLISAKVVAQEEETILPLVSNLRTAAVTSTDGPLSSGVWYKIGVEKDGVYAISYDMLKDMGLNPSSINPNNIKVFGNGGGMLPQENSVQRAEGLLECAISVTGSGDGSFDKGDYVLFYGEGAHEVVYNEVSGLLEHVYNVYTNTNYYYVTVGETAGKRIQAQASVGTSTLTVSSFDDYQFYEKDLYNHVKSGREWFGEDMTSANVPSFQFDSRNIVGSNYKITGSEMTMSVISTEFKYYANNSLIGTSTHGTSGLVDYGKRGNLEENVFTGTVSSNIGDDLSINIQYNSKGNREAVSHLNYLGINLKRELRIYDGQTVFRSIESIGEAVTSFEFSGLSSSAKVWNITNHNEVTSMVVSSNKCAEATTELQTFVVFSSYLSPLLISSVDNQNLRVETQAPDLLIITHQDFINEAEDLAAFKRSNDGLSVKVTLISEVYNEFSSGKQDVSAVRDYVRYLYNLGNGNDGLKYLLLFGDASYDYKNIYEGNSNFVPIYESRESLNNVNSYSSDDYFTFMDDSEGLWTESISGDHTMDLSVGRLPVQTRSQAEAVVNKIIHYSTSTNTLGKWKNSMCFVADDGDNNLHVGDSDKLSIQAETNEPGINNRKYFVDSFSKSNTTAGVFVPEMTASLIRSIEEGLLIVNYNGHGNEIQWSGESILNTSDINKLKNFDKLPFFITATCEFGRYDDALATSAAEALVLNPDGGSIGTLTTTRPVYASSNFVINSAFYDNVFVPNPDGSRPRIGEVMMLTKNQSLKGVNNRNFSLLGDPSITLAYPNYNTVITKINDVPVVAGVADTLKALGVVTMSGEIQDFSGELLSSFNGVTNVSVFDKRSEKSTLGQGDNTPYTFSVQENKLFEGRVSVKDGVFSLAFVVPKDIAYNFDAGKVSMYAAQESSLLDASGYHTDVIIGGTDLNAVPDNTPPEVQMFMDSTNFLNGGRVKPNTTLLAFFNDESGINTAGNGVGHELLAVLDGDVSNAIVLNSFYEADLDEYKSGSLQYLFKDLSPGKHVLELKVWDTHNNSTLGRLEFVVDDIRLDIKNYPNPFVSETTISIEQNRIEEAAEIECVILDAMGREVKRFNESTEDLQYLYEWQWNASDEFGQRLSAGMYYYTVNIRYLKDGRTLSAIKKMMLFN